MKMSIRDVMTADPVSVSPAIPVDRIAGMMRDHGIGSIPVVDGDELKGMVTDRDIIVRCVALGRQPAATFAEDVCTAEVQTVALNDSTRDAANIMRRHALRRLPVVYGPQLVGMLSIGDVARAVDEQSPLSDISQAPSNS